LLLLKEIHLPNSDLYIGTTNHSQIQQKTEGMMLLKARWQRGSNIWKQQLFMRRAAVERQQYRHRKRQSRSSTSP
jgi:hypothetical protein